MAARVKWTDRTFDFNFPTGLYPEIIERLRGAPVRLEEHCRDVPVDVLTLQQDGRWSMQENAVTCWTWNPSFNNELVNICRARKHFMPPTCRTARRTKPVTTMVLFKRSLANSDTNA